MSSETDPHMRPQAAKDDIAAGNEDGSPGPRPGLAKDETPVVFPALVRHAWWRALARLDRATRHAAGRPDPSEMSEAYDALVGALIDAALPDVPTAIAVGIASLPSPVASAARSGLPEGLRAALRRDLDTLGRMARTDYASLCEANGLTAPLPLSTLAPALDEDDPADGRVLQLLAGLTSPDLEDRVVRVEGWFARHGAGPAALHPALRWSDGGLVSVRFPDIVDLGTLVGLEPTLERLRENTEALLRGAPAHDALLYGPRGSGKSTAVRGLLARYQDAGLRLVEVPLEALHELPVLIERLRDLPQSFVLFVDDLAFEDGDQRYRPLKSLLEGGLAKRPSNVAVYATSNRRHLLRERHRERPDPLDDDVHRWDTHHERLALADRFGLTLTFPDANQRRYLEVVKGLMERHHLHVEDLHERAIRFAEWGNGYSGRTARQFVDGLLQAPATGEGPTS